MIELTGRLTMTVEQIETFGRLTEAASRGDGDAACRLGDMHREGLGGLRYSPKLAFHWYARSALVGDPNGQNNLGACYEHGLGCEQSYARAVKWYRPAAARCLGTASMNLGYCAFRRAGAVAEKWRRLHLPATALRAGRRRREAPVRRCARGPRRTQVLRFARSQEVDPRGGSHQRARGCSRKKLRSRPERRVILQLALALGRADPDAMLREISARQLAEWFAFAFVEGFGDRRADLRMGILASLIANVHRDAKRKPSPYKPGDFIPRIKEDEERMKERDLRAALDSIAKPKRS